MRRVALAALVSAATVAAPASAGEIPPAPTHCHLEVKKTYRQAAVLKRGLPVKIRCDAPATVAVSLEFHGPIALRHELARMFSEGDPGAEGFYKHDIVFSEPGSVTVRLKFRPYAQRLARRFRRVEAFVPLIVLDPDGAYRIVPKENAFPVLVR